MICMYHTITIIVHSNVPLLKNVPSQSNTNADIE